MSFSLSYSAQSGTVPLLFLPGWGFDARLVSLYHLFSDSSLILPGTFVNPYFFSDMLRTFLHKKKIERISMLGWSMGAQTALSFSLSHPHMVASLTLVAMRSSWPPEELAGIREAVIDDPHEYMRSFYRKCFLGHKKPYQLFVHELQADYLCKLDKEILLAGLDYLQEFRQPLQIPEGVAIHVIHGRKDRVAPAGEMPRIPGATREIFPHAGHMVLLNLRRGRENV